MQRQRTFIWSAIGGIEPGWMPENSTKGWFPGGGFLTAHDVLEHLSDKTDWAHELRAAGVSLYSLPGYAHRDADTVASDIISFAARDHHFAAPTAPERWSKPLAEREEARVQKLASALRVQIDNGLERAKVNRSKVPQAALDNAPSFVDKALPWIRLGFMGAKRVYAGHSGTDVGHLLGEVRDAVNKDHDELPPVKGDKLVVNVDTRNFTVSVKRELGDPKMSRKDRERAAFVEHLSAAIFGG